MVPDLWRTEPPFGKRSHEVSAAPFGGASCLFVQRVPQADIRILNGSPASGALPRASPASAASGLSAGLVLAALAALLALLPAILTLFAAILTLFAVLLAFLAALLALLSALLAVLGSVLISAVATTAVAGAISVSPTHGLHLLCSVPARRPGLDIPGRRAR